MRLKLLVAYDGGAFQGWQSQAGGNTVQDHLERAFEMIEGGTVRVHGSGRTDTGVHAVGQIAHADVTKTTLTPADWLRALNGNLPAQIRVMRCTRAGSAFHARFSATGKIYVYRIWNAPVLLPTELGRVWHLPGNLDLSVLKCRAKLLEGIHDFAGFSANRGKPEASTVRTVHSIKIQKKGALITMEFRGGGFLYKMVRLMTGSLVRCAQGRAEAEWLQRLLAGKEKTSFAAPAEGLYLKQVLYGK